MRKTTSMILLAAMLLAALSACGGEKTQESQDMRRADTRRRLQPRPFPVCY